LCANVYENITIDGFDIDRKEFDDEMIKMLILMALKHFKK